MRNFNFFKTITIYLLLFSGGLLSAQQLIVEQENITPENKIKYQRHFDGDNYTLFSEESTERVYIHNELLNQNDQTTGEEEVNVLLSINLEFDAEQSNPPGVVRIFNESGSLYMAYWEEINPITINLPAGVYDIVADFSSGQTRYTIVKELIDVSESSTVELNVADATNYISINSYIENGEPLEPGVYNENTDSYSMMFFDRTLYFNPSNTKIAYYSYAWGSQFTGDPVWNFYINDVSERYSIVQSAIGTGYESGNNYFSKFPTITSIDQSLTIHNNPEDYAFHEEKIQPSPLGVSSGNLHPGFSTISTYNGNFMVSWTFYNTGDPLNVEESTKFYLNNSLEENAGGLLVFPLIVDYMDDTEEVFHIMGNAIVSGENNEVFYGSGATAFSWYFLGYNYYYTENGLKVAPFHPRFSFSASENPEIIQGNNAPISVILGSGNYLIPQYKGRYGEIREGDFYDTDIEVKQDGTIVYSGNYRSNFSMPHEGVLDLTLTNNNIEVDGLAGKNITQIRIDQNQDDMSAPTLQILQFRNATGRVTDRFSSVSDGTVRIAAGDFENINVGEYFGYKEGNSVELYYSLYNQDNWTELELTEYPEHFFMPAFGDYYEASLSSVIVPEENSWFDVKIICTDAAGNKQEQIVSPAFKIGEINMEIEEAEKSGLMVYPNPFSSELNIQLPENIKGNYTFKISDLTGKTIYSKSQNEKSFVWNGSPLPKGVYLISIENKVKVIARKVIKK
ncbi:T9SS type A sorting domain-containing protein [Moheibacter sediminis]|uniref:Por secretion system C-terminal sorting domain-containing protein n=1 Tax=Moheibacter sediminis TaxID=1434700 RepID=A0A1W1YA35_9FLAO|nr:T9SS type A sorting domain-containing protein [Moheibacter sediminis]SMC33003.1 Por secretion system C-terminal sorting domain-containing protein [Moheibacter sediminis]